MSIHASKMHLIDETAAEGRGQEDEVVKVAALATFLLADREIALALVVFPGASDLPLFKLAIDDVVIPGAVPASSVGFKVDDSGFLIEGTLGDRCGVRPWIEDSGNNFPVVLQLSHHLTAFD